MKFRILTLLLAVCMMLTLLPSCGKAAPTKPQNVFRETRLDVPESLMKKGANSNISRYLQSGDRVYMQGFEWNNETGDQIAYILSVDMTDGSFGERIDIKLEQRDDGGSSLNSFTVAADGTIWLMIENFTYGGEAGYQQTSELRRLKDGKTETIELGELIDEETGDRFYISSMAALPDGSLLLQSWTGMKLMSPDGKVSDVKLETDFDEYQVEAVKQMNNKIYLSIWVYSGEQSGNRLFEFDPQTGKLGDEMKINSNHIYNMIPGPGYDYYHNDRSSLWGVSADGEMTEVINFVNSDINGNNIQTIIPLSKDRFFAVLRTFTNAGDVTTEMAFLDRVPQDQVVEKKMLRMAVPYTNYDLRTAIIAFNKANDEYRITIDDYSRYNTTENYNAGADKLNTDIISGNVPDLFMLNSESPYDTYASKGVFADLYKLMDADEDFDRSLYLENVLKAFEYDGELLSLAPEVMVTTFAAKEELLGDIDGWTMAEFLEYAEAHPDMEMFDYEFTRESFLERAMMFSRDQFVEKETGKTNFDSPEFKALMEFAKSMPVENFWETLDREEQNSPDFWMEYENRFADEKVLLAQWSLYGIEYSFKELLAYSLKAEPVFVGFPVSEGNGAMFAANTEYAIGSRSKFKEGAWEFLKTLISEDAQMPVLNEEYNYWNYPVSGVPILRAALDKMFEIAMTPPDPEDMGVIIGGGIARPLVSAETVAAIEVETETAEIVAEEVIEEDTSDKIAVEDWSNVDPYQRPLTEAQRDKMMALIDSTTQVERRDAKLQAIINEEAAHYFAGTKSLDETVTIIQNRARIYISESR